ncbi:Helix-turn-helix domain-containing protein [Nocardioides sp. YR527]|uniref:helix-turn-helix domain-containing protein n=1 Tax=Nocardioides sp. YR527 TaxID=1881028 RepID=UPI0008860D7A|nr:helix-turn-helix transcriptional regulator [Nocardioides sp. YR527]SDL17439.1 Helix-turn-helix domain-containing protein [Nocardioides sp. YR527]
MGSSLGDRLREVRKIRGVSLKAVAAPAEISVAYLQKLEGGDVQQPSPHVLHRLSQVLEVPYAALMELAGYVIPQSDGVLAANTFDHALNSSDLTAEERKAVAAYVALLRQQRSQ